MPAYWPNKQVQPVAVILPLTLQTGDNYYYYYYYYYKICIAHKFKRARVRGAGVARWGT